MIPATLLGVGATGKPADLEAFEQQRRVEALSDR
jgi:hypothetical protein